MLVGSRPLASDDSSSTQPAVIMSFKVSVVLVELAVLPLSAIRNPKISLKSLL